MFPDFYFKKANSFTLNASLSNNSSCTTILILASSLFPHTRPKAKFKHFYQPPNPQQNNKTHLVK